MIERRSFLDKGLLLDVLYDALRIRFYEHGQSISVVYDKDVGDNWLLVKQLEKRLMSLPDVNLDRVDSKVYRRGLPNQYVKFVPIGRLLHTEVEDVVLVSTTTVQADTLKLVFEKSETLKVFEGVVND